MMKETLIGRQLGCGKEAECQQQICTHHFGIEMGVVRYRKCDIKCCSGDLCPLKPNATLYPPRETLGPQKGARGGVGTVRIEQSLVWMTLLISCLSYFIFIRI